MRRLIGEQAVLPLEIGHRQPGEIGQQFAFRLAERPACMVVEDAERTQLLSIGRADERSSGIKPDAGSESVAVAPHNASRIEPRTRALRRHGA